MSARGFHIQHPWQLKFSPSCDRSWSCCFSLRPANTPTHACIHTHTVSASESHIQHPWWSTFSRVLPKLEHFMSPAPQNMDTNTVSVQVSHTSLTPTQNSTAPLTLMMMSWCLMSSDVIWHIRDKLWPMPKHGSIKSTYVRCMRV